MALVKSNYIAKLKRIGIVTGISLIILMVLLFAFISPIAKYLIEKYDDKILGRTIELSWVYVNPFTGYVYLKNVKVYEQNSDSIMFKADAISADFSMRKLFQKTYEISSLTVYKPWGHIIQNKGQINFRDIIDHFSPKQGTIVVNKERVRFSILDCSIKDGQFQYDEVTTPVTYFVKHVNIHSPGKSWDSDTMIFKIALVSGPTSGIVNGYLSINFKTLNYNFGGVIDTFDLKPLTQYMKVLSNYGDFGGIVNAKVRGSGNFRSKFVRTSGLIAIKVFQFGPSIYEDYGSFQRLVLNIIDADPERKKYLIDSIMLDRPYFRYEKYDSLDNLALMFGKAGTKPGIYSSEAQFNLILKIVKYLQDLLVNFAHSDYKINKFTIYKGNLIFKDFSPYENFSIDAMPVHIHADSIDKNKSRIKIFSNIAVRPYGNLHLNASLDPKNFGTFDIDYSINKVPASIFNPYLITYTSFPFNRGTLQLRGEWKVLDSAINSTNHLLVINPRVGKKLKGHNTKWLPMPLMMSLARGAGNVIDFEIPVRGDLKKPEFVLKPVILDIVRNIFIKPPLTPYLMHVKQQENTMEKMLNVDWGVGQSTLTPVEHKFVNAMTSFLKHNPENTITVSQMTYSAKEKEHIAFFEGKKKYFLLSQVKGYKISKNDSFDIEEMSVKDILFVRFLEKLGRDSMMFSTEQKCRYLVGDNLIEARLEQLNVARKKAFLEKFVETGTVAQLKFTPSQSVIPYNGFSSYKINYNGDVPEKLRKAYEAMDEMNEQIPRKKYKKDRWLPRIQGIERKKRNPNNTD